MCSSDYKSVIQAFWLFLKLTLCSCVPQTVVYKEKLNRLGLFSLDTRVKRDCALRSSMKEVNHEVFAVSQNSHLTQHQTGCH